MIESGNHKQTVEELSGQFEGDIVLTAAQRDAITGVTRNGLVDLTARWPNNVVKYEITDQLNESEKQQVLTSLRTIESVSCIRFEERSATDTDYVEVIVSLRCCYKIDYIDTRRNFYFRVKTLAAGQWSAESEENKI